MVDHIRIATIIYEVLSLLCPLDIDDHARLASSCLEMMSPLGVKESPAYKVRESAQQSNPYHRSASSILPLKSTVNPVNLSYPYIRW